MYSDIEKNILHQIAWYYTDKNKVFKDDPENKNEDEHFKRSNLNRQEINELGITNLKYLPETNKIDITLKRPGVFIGEKGKNLQNITSYIETEIPMLKGVSFHIIENTIDFHLFGVLDVIEDEEDFY